MLCWLQGPQVNLAPVRAPTSASASRQQPGGARTSKLTSTTRRFSTVAEVRKAAKKAARTLERICRRRRRRRAARRALKRRWRKRIREMRAAQAWLPQPPTAMPGARAPPRVQRSLPPRPPVDQPSQAVALPAAGDPVDVNVVRALQPADTASAAGQASTSVRSACGTHTAPRLVCTYNQPDQHDGVMR